MVEQRPAPAVAAGAGVVAAVAEGEVVAERGPAEELVGERREPAGQVAAPAVAGEEPREHVAPGAGVEGRVGHVEHAEDAGPGVEHAGGRVAAGEPGGGRRERRASDLWPGAARGLESALTVEVGVVALGLVPVGHEPWAAVAVAAARAARHNADVAVDAAAGGAAAVVDSAAEGHRTGSPLADRAESCPVVGDNERHYCAKQHS